MEEWGLLGIYKNLGEITTHESRVREARNELQLESAALQYSTNVNLKGDFEVDNFHLITSNYGLYLSMREGVGVGEDGEEGVTDGEVRLADISLPAWVASNYMDKIYADRFHNDKQFVGIDGDLMRYSHDVRLSENDFIYTENLMNLRNRPSFDDIKKDYGFDGDFCGKGANLGTLIDAHVSRTNLGLGNVSLQSEDFVYFQNLHVLENFRLPQYFSEGTYLHIDDDDKLRNREYALPYLHHEIPFGHGSTSNALPSMTLMSNVSQLVACNIDDTAKYNKEYMTSNQSLITDLIYQETLFTSDNLMSNTSKEEKETCMQNLSIGDVSTQNSNEVDVTRVSVDGDVRFIDRSSNLFFDDAWMATDDFVHRNVPENYSPSFVSVDDIFTLDKSSNFSEVFNQGISNLEDDANLSFSDFAFNLFHVNCNLDGLTDVPLARSRLNLNPVAVTGRLRELTRRPAYLSELENDVNYYKRLLNFADVHPRFLKVTRQNIGVSNMALEDADNIGGTEGFPLGVANRKFHSTDCKLDTVIAEKGQFIMKSLDLTTEVGHDFLCVERYDKIISGIKNFKYRYKKIEKCDEEFFTGPFVYDQSQYVRVRINDLTTANLLNVIGGQDTDFDAAPKDYVVAEYFVPSCKFTYDAFSAMASNIMHRVGIPEKFFVGDVDSIEYFNRQF